MQAQIRDAVFEEINRLQHPANCSAARKLVCYLNKGCGFGCQIHHAVHCLAHSVALNRTLILVVSVMNTCAFFYGRMCAVLP